MNTDMNKERIPLTELAAGKQAQVEIIQGGNNLIGRLAGVGITPGVEVTMVQNFRKRPVIVNVRYTQIALGRSVASKIYVK